MQYSVINYKTVKKIGTLRFDAEYFHPDYLYIAKLIQEKEDQFISLKKLKIKCDASAFYPTLEPYYGQGNIPFIRVADVDDGINYEQILTIPKQILDEYKTLNLGKKGDIVLTKGGSIARAGLVTKNSALTRDLIFFNTSKLKEDDYIFNYVYCLTEFYKKQLIQSSSMTAQPHLTITLVRDIPFFNPNEKFKKIIVSLFKMYSSFLENSKFFYSQAEQLLLSELGLLNWKPKHELVFIKNFADAKDADRFDAEYFQPKYEEIIEAIKKYKGGFNDLGKLVKIKDENFTPKDDEQYKYIELANISSNGEINGYTKTFGAELPSRARRKVQKGHLIVSSIEGSLESIALITEDWTNALCSTGFFVVHSDEINSETLLVLLKNKIGQLQLKKGCKGTILTAISKDELYKIVLPKIDIKIQKEIKDRIIKMYKAKKLSKSLLKIAKRGVEMSIEKDEQQAKQWIDHELDNLKIYVNL